MNGKETIQAALEATRSTLNWFVSDLSDADLFVRPVPAANHIAWQIGNVIVGDRWLVTSQLPDAAYPELPAGFMETHGPDRTEKDGPDGFLDQGGIPVALQRGPLGHHRHGRRALGRRPRPPGHGQGRGLRPDPRALCSCWSPTTP